MSPPRPDPNQEWKKSKAKTEDLLALLNSGFLWEKEVDMWRSTAGDPYPMEKSPDEIPMFTRFAEPGLSLPASDFFKGLLGYYGIEYLNLNLNPNGIFHTSVFVPFCEAPAQHQQSPSSGGSWDPDEGGCHRAVPLVQADRLQPGLECKVVLRHQPPPGAAEDKREATQAPSVVELGANDVGGYPTTRAAGED
jgi:hypothetical protein